MKRTLLPFTLVLLTALTLVPVMSADETPASGDGSTTDGKYVLPEDPKAEIIVLDFKGGFTPPRISEEPTMTIRADGTVDIPARFKGEKSFHGKLGRKEIDKLLDFILEDNKFFEYDEAKVLAKLRAKGPAPLVADAATTVIRVAANNEIREVRHYALGIGPKVPELEQLLAIQRRLLMVHATVELGGREEVEKLLEPINAELKKRYPAAKPLTVDDLQSGNVRADDSVFASFSRSSSRADGTRMELTSATFNKPAKGRPTITVVHR